MLSQHVLAETLQRLQRLGSTRVCYLTTGAVIITLQLTRLLVVGNH